MAISAVDALREIVAAVSEERAKAEPLRDSLADAIETLERLSSLFRPESQDHEPEAGEAMTRFCIGVLLGWLVLGPLIWWWMGWA
jgi:hypothetical protein